MIMVCRAWARTAPTRALQAAPCASRAFTWRSRRTPLGSRSTGYASREKSDELRLNKTLVGCFCVVSFLSLNVGVVFSQTKAQKEGNVAH